MTNWLINKSCLIRSTHNKPLHWFLLSKLVFTLWLLVTLSACGVREPKKIGLSGIAYNYTDQTVVSVRVNGQEASSVMDGVHSGGVSGGAVVCCLELSNGATEAEVEVDLGLSTFTTRAKIEKWWPDLANYAVVHVLPGEKVVMQITPSSPLPRKDLLEAQQQALGQPVQVKFQMWSAGPLERIDGKH